MSFASDVPVSLPAPADPAEPVIDMFGFALTKWGVRPALSAADHEHLSTLHRAGQAGPVVWDDAHLEGR